RARRWAALGAPSIARLLPGVKRWRRPGCNQLLYTVARPRVRPRGPPPATDRIPMESGAAVQPHPDLDAQIGRGQVRSVLLCALLNVQRTVAGAHGVILVGEGRPEQGH